VRTSDGYDRYGAPGFLAAYNSGPARYESYLAGRRELPPETTAYVARLAPAIDGASASPPIRVAPAPREWRISSLFFGRADDRANGGSGADSAAVADVAPARSADHADAANARTAPLFVAPTGRTLR
jgi:hypothetical protein